MGSDGNGYCTYTWSMFRRFLKPECRGGTFRHLDLETISGQSIFDCAIFNKKRISVVYFAELQVGLDGNESNVLCNFEALLLPFV